ncbi:MAG: hypothetical protein ACKVQT_34120 [Burkholderiales bacterium]
MNTSRLALMVLTSAALFATGCANTSAPPDAGKTKVMSVEQISKQWKQGSDLVTEGEDAKRKAQDKIDAANVQLKEGDSMVTRGKTLMLESEQAFRDTSRNTKSN